MVIDRWIVCLFVVSEMKNWRIVFIHNIHKEANGGADATEKILSSNVIRYSCIDAQPPSYSKLRQNKNVNKIRTRPEATTLPNSSLYPTLPKPWCPPRPRISHCDCDVVPLLDHTHNTLSHPYRNSLETSSWLLLRLLLFLKRELMKIKKIKKKRTLNYVF